MPKTKKEEKQDDSLNLEDVSLEQQLDMEEEEDESQDGPDSLATDEMGGDVDHTPDAQQDDEAGDEAHTEDTDQTDESDDDEAGGSEESDGDETDQTDEADQPDDEEDGGDQDNEDDEETPLYQELMDHIGVELDEDEMADIEDTPEGISKLVKKSTEKMTDQQLQKLFNEYEHVGEFLEFRMNGGDPEEYFNTMYPDRDYNEIEISEDDTATQKQLVREFLNEAGYEEDEIDQTLQNYENGGILEQQSEIALKKLRQSQQKKKENLKAEQQKKAKKQQQQIRQYWEDIRETLDETNDLYGLPVPEAEKDDFFDFMSKPVEDGMSERDKKVQNLSEEEQLFIDYVLYKGIDKLPEIIDRKASTKKSKNIRNRLKSQDEKDKINAGNKKQPDSGGGGEDVDTDDLDLQL